jgi:hypothetical protein
MKEMLTLQFTSASAQIPPLYLTSTSGLPLLNSLFDGGTNDLQITVLASCSQCTLLTISAVGQQSVNSSKTLQQVGWVSKTSPFHQ